MQMSRAFSLIVVGWGIILGSVLGHAEEILLPSQPALSPDGQRIAFACEGDLWTVPVAGGQATRLTVHPADESQPRFSPDGTQIAFVSNRTGSNQVFVMPVTGGEPRQVTHHSAGYTLEGWSPDGRALLVSGIRDHYWRDGNRFFLVNLEQRTADQLLFDAYGSQGQLSPDGQKLLFVREGERWWRKGFVGSRSAQIWLYDRETAEFHKLVDKPTDCYWPLWKPDGQGFYFTCGENSDGYNIWEYELESGEQKQITRFPADSTVFPSLSHDGSTLIFRHLFHLYTFLPGVDQLPQRLKVERDGDTAYPEIWRRRVERADNASFTADGLEIAFVAGGDLWVMDTELREPRQVTHTPEEEREPVFADDGKALYYISDQEGQTDLWKAEPAIKGESFWESRDFTLTRLTNSPEIEFNLTLSPDQEHLFFLRKRGDLWRMRTDGTDPRKIYDSWGPLDYAVSPDGKWIAASINDDDFNADIYLFPVDGSSPPYNISRHPSNDSGPAWSPDGKILAFTGRRESGEVDIHYVYLQKELDDQSSRDRKLEKAREKFEKSRPQPKEIGPQAAEKKEPDAKPAVAGGEKKPTLPDVVIDFDELHKRVRRVSIADSTESGLFFSHDSTKLYFSANIKGQAGTYSIELPEKLTPQLLLASTGRLARSLPKTKTIVWLSGGTPGSVTSTGTHTRYTFRVDQEVDRRARFRTVFDQCWRVMRDRWYDERLGNRNWDEVRRKYLDAAGQVSDLPRLSTIVHLMLGELNGSHLGFTARDESVSSPTPQWREETAHLGVRFAQDYKGPGLKIRDVIPGGPAAKSGSELWAGEVILSIDGVAVDPTYDLTQILNGSLERDFTLTVQADDEAKTERTVTLRPISYGRAVGLLYPYVMEQRQEFVDQQTGGKFGYLHIKSMNLESFVQFEKHLYEVGYGRDGLIIDVRDNGGGFTTDHLLTALTQPRHAITVPRGGGRGYPQDRSVYATWHKPIVVLCNQNSYSNAEIFSHAIKGLQRGQLVGVPTAGGVVSTGAVSIFDMGTLRLPFRGWYVLDTGEDMELHGAEPHHILWPQPGELPQGTDVQLEKAIEVLQGEVDAWQARPPVQLRKATER